jgi:hypothetical protein
MTLNEAKRMLATVAAAFPNVQDRNLAMTARIWQVALSDLDPCDVNLAITKLLMTQRFFPTVAEIREAAENLSPMAHPSPEEAWAEVNAHLCRSKTAPYSDPLIVKAISGIGWNTIAMSENVGVERAHFMRFYETMLKKEREERTNTIARRLMENAAGVFLADTGQREEK